MVYARRHRRTRYLHPKGGGMAVNYSSRRRSRSMGGSSVLAGIMRLIGRGGKAHRTGRYKRRSFSYGRFKKRRFY